MKNNDIFRRTLHLFELNKETDTVIEIFKNKGINATPAKIKRWRTSLDNKNASFMPDFALQAFLDGLHEHKITLEATHDDEKAP